MTFRVAIAGFGAIGKVIAQRLDQGIEGLTLAAIAARDVARAQAAMAGFVRPVPVVPLAGLWEHADVVVECAPAAVLREIAEPALGNGRIVMVLSCGALLDNFFNAAMTESAVRRPVRGLSSDGTFSTCIDRRAAAASTSMR